MIATKFLMLFLFYVNTDYTYYLELQESAKHKGHLALFKFLVLQVGHTKYNGVHRVYCNPLPNNVVRHGPGRRQSGRLIQLQKVLNFSSRSEGPRSVGPRPGRTLFFSRAERTGPADGGPALDASQCGNDRPGFDMIAVTPKTAII
jgi:hypothetical protein